MTSTYVAVIATIAWLAAMVLLLLVSRPRAARAAVDDGWPVDPPALAALLVQPYKLRAPVAAAATLLDLVARGGFAIETYPPDRVFLRLAGRMGDLRPYERHVFDQLAVRAARGDGRVPADALAPGSGEHARSWYARFTELLESDARELGLVAPRVPYGVRVVLWLALLAVFGLASAAAVEAHRATLIGFLALGYRLVSLPAGRLRRLVPRGAGVGVAARCRALAAALAVPRGAGVRSPERADATAGWPAPGDRRPAFALAVGAVRPGADPFTPVPRDAVWSNRTGEWRLVPLVHGRGMISGASPGSGLASLAGAVPFLAAWAVLLGYFTTHLSAARAAQVWPPALLVAGWLVWCWIAAFVTRFAGQGVYDLTHPPLVLAGPVVHLESRLGAGDDDADHFYAAVDDGTGGPAAVYEIDRATHDRLRLHHWLRLVVTPKLGHVRPVEIISD